eukprot:150488-Pelagomonas_calceolata.AAC.1
MLSASKIPTQDFLADLGYRQQKVWREVDAFSPRLVNRKAVTYHHWCSPLQEIHQPCMPPPRMSPLVTYDMDTALHILSGCQCPAIRNM